MREQRLDVALRGLSFPGRNMGGERVGFDELDGAGQYDGAG